jgi:hypothetical protein
MNQRDMLRQRYSTQFQPFYQGNLRAFSMAFFCSRFVFLWLVQP